MSTHNIFSLRNKKHIYLEIPIFQGYVSHNISTIYNMEKMRQNVIGCIKTYIFETQRIDRNNKQIKFSLKIAIFSKLALWYIYHDKPFSAYIIGEMRVGGGGVGMKYIA